MKVVELVGRLWYGQKIAIVNWREYDKAMQEKGVYDYGKSLFVGENHKLRSVVYNDLLHRKVDSYGVSPDGMFIIEVH